MTLGHAHECHDTARSDSSNRDGHSAAYTSLPGRPLVRGPLTLDQAISELPRPQEPWLPIKAGTFTRIHELQEFPEVVEGLGPPTRRTRP